MQTLGTSIGQARMTNSDAVRARFMIAAAETLRRRLEIGSKSGSMTIVEINSRLTGVRRNMGTISAPTRAIIIFSLRITMERKSATLSSSKNSRFLRFNSTRAIATSSHSNMLRSESRIFISRKTERT
eukprot:6282902-Prymnesium_polylepis.1